jgi:predicted dehydrogenase
MSAPLRVGLIGAGNIAEHHLRAFIEFPEIVHLAAVSDRVVARAERLAAASGHEPRVYSDTAELLRSDDLDAVDICMPHDAHAPIAVAAAEAGLHVLVEKPMATSLAGCFEMVAAAERAGVTLMVAQNQRYLPTYRAAKAVLDSGELGPILALRTDSIQNWHGFLPDDHWQYDAVRAGGGVLINVAVHRIDLLRYLVGDVRAVVAAECRTTDPRFVNGAEDTATAILEYENGALGTLFATANAFRSPWSEQFVIFGERGTLHAVPPPGNVRGDAHVASIERSPALDGLASQFVGFERVDPDDACLPTDNGQVNEILHFADCCRQGTEPVSSGSDNLKTMSVVFAIYEAARRGARVELADLSPVLPT